MKGFARMVALAAIFGGWIGSLPASATGTAIVQKPDGSTRTYTDVSVRLARQELAFTTSDGVGTLVLAKAACEKVDVLVKCLPYDGTLFQHNLKVHIELRSGTVWLNPTMQEQLLPDASARIKPHGVLLTMTTKLGFFVSFNGTVDEIQR